MHPRHGRAIAWVVLAWAATVAQGMAFSELPDKIGPYHEVVGTVVVFLGAALALSGKGVLRLYAGVCGCLLGAFASYLVIERIDHTNPIGPNKPAIEVLVAFFAAMAGIALFLSLVRLVVVGVGVLGGLVLTAFLLSIPFVERVRHTVPVWAITLTLVVICTASVWMFEATVLLVFTAVVGAFFAAMGVDMWLQTGFNEQVVALLTHHPTTAFRVSRAMLPLLYTFLGVLAVGAISQAINARREEQERKRRDSSLPFIYNNERTAPLRNQRSFGAQARVVA